MLITLLSNPPDEIFGDAIVDWVEGLENWCVLFNEFFILLFFYLKFILVFILFSVGTLTLLKLRKVYMQARIRAPSVSGITGDNGEERP